MTDHLEHFRGAVAVLQRRRPARQRDRQLQQQRLIRVPARLHSRNHQHKGYEQYKNVEERERHEAVLEEKRVGRQHSALDRRARVAEQKTVLITC